MRKKKIDAFPYLMCLAAVVLFTLFVVLPFAVGVYTSFFKWDGFSDMKFNGLTIWNDYFMANIMITKDVLRTLPLSIANFVGKHSTNYPELFAMLTMATIPVIIVFVLSQKSFIEGVAAGAVKG